MLIKVDSRIRSILLLSFFSYSDTSCKQASVDRASHCRRFSLLAASLAGWHLCDIFESEFESSFTLALSSWPAILPARDGEDFFSTIPYPLSFSCYLTHTSFLRFIPLSPTFSPSSSSPTASSIHNTPHSCTIHPRTHTIPSLSNSALLRSRNGQNRRHKRRHRPHLERRTRRLTQNRRRRPRHLRHYHAGVYGECWGWNDYEYGWSCKDMKINSS